MNLEALRSCALRIDLSQSYSQQQAGRHLAEAFRLLEKAERRNFVPGSICRRAGAALHEAMRYARGEACPLLAMAWLASRLGDEGLTRCCLADALSLDPTHPLAWELLHGLDRHSYALGPGQPMPPICPEDAGALGIQLERKLVARVLTIMKQSQYQLSPAASEDRADAIARALGELRGLCREFVLSLQQLELYLDTGNLRERLRPLAAQIKRQQDRLHLCGELRLLRQGLETSLAACQRVSAEFSLHRAARSLQPELELLLDDCDHFADRIDALDQRGIETDELLGLYRALTTRVTELQERQARYRHGLPYAHPA